MFICPLSSVLSGVAAPDGGFWAPQRYVAAVLRWVVVVWSRMT